MFASVIPERSDDHSTMPTVGIAVLSDLLLIVIEQVTGLLPPAPVLDVEIAPPVPALEPPDARAEVPPVPVPPLPVVPPTLVVEPLLPPDPPALPTVTLVVPPLLVLLRRALLPPRLDVAVVPPAPVPPSNVLVVPPELPAPPV